MNHQTQSIIKPLALIPGDTVGIVAPAGPYDPALFEKGINVLESMGFRIKLPEGIQQSKGFLAGEDAHRASLVNACFADSEIQGVLCARGGYGSMRILERLDGRMIQQNPKVFVGFSDITALHVFLNQVCGLVTFHGPVATTMANAPTETRQALVNTLRADQPLSLPAGEPVVIQPGQAAGPVVGGNLTTLCHLLGTPFAPDFKGRILLLEETNEAPYRIDRMLFQMRMAGCFEGVKGVALGTFHQCGPWEEILNVAKRIFADYAVPVLAGFDIGHGPVNLTVPLGVPAILDTRKRSLAYVEAATGSRPQHG